jgi:hypothetical protein
MNMSEAANKLASDKLHQLHLSEKRELTEQIRMLEDEKAAMSALIARLLAPDTTAYEIVHGRFCPIRCDALHR